MLNLALVATTFAPASVETQRPGVEAGARVEERPSKEVKLDE